MTYKRQIAYLDYMELGEKKGSGGFCKWEQKNGMHILEISVNRVNSKLPEKASIFTKTGHELGAIQIKKGSALSVFSKEIGEGNWEWEFTQIRIPLGEGRELFAEFPMSDDYFEHNARLIGTEEKVIAIGTEKIPEENLTIETKESPEENLTIETEESQEENLVIETEELQEENLALETEEFPEGVLVVETVEPSLHSLCDCLAKNRKTVHPFGTDVEYYYILLEDIFLLKDKYHVLRNNPFLLHGYYNYKYLILGKKDVDSEEYWLGVPGIYHEREKMAARMYGFEKFEGAKPGYVVGDLGYYLITVE